MDSLVFQIFWQPLFIHSWVSWVFLCTNNIISFKIIPHEDGFSKNNNSYIKSGHYNIFDDCGVNVDQPWMNEDWFYTTKYVVFDNEGMTTERSLPDNLKWWIITQPKVLRKYRKHEEFCKSISLFSSYFSGPGKIKYTT